MTTADEKPAPPLSAEIETADAFQSSLIVCGDDKTCIWLIEQRDAAIAAQARAQALSEVEQHIASKFPLGGAVIIASIRRALGAQPQPAEPTPGFWWDTDAGRRCPDLSDCVYSCQANDSCKRESQRQPQPAERQEARDE